MNSLILSPITAALAISADALFMIQPFFGMKLSGVYSMFAARKLEVKRGHTTSSSSSSEQASSTYIARSTDEHRRTARR